MTTRVKYGIQVMSSIYLGRPVVKIAHVGILLSEQVTAPRVISQKSRFHETPMALYNEQRSHAAMHQTVQMDL